MAQLSKVKPSIYYDSVQLMRVSQALSGLYQVKQAIVAMGTDANKRVLNEVGLLTNEAAAAGANDLMIVVEAESDGAARSAVEEASGAEKKKAIPAQPGPPRYRRT